MSPTIRFDSEALYAGLDAVRQSRKLTWRQVAKESGVSASTLTRIAQGKRPDVDGFASLVRWSGLSGDQFLRRGDPSSAKARNANPLATISTYLRSDPNLSRESAAALDQVIKVTYQHLRKKD